MIVRYTNEYEEAKGDDYFLPITRKEFIDFIAILYMSPIQKRRDKPRHWFSSGPLLECRIMKKIMSGNRFYSILRTLHVCSLEKQPSQRSAKYNPLYKEKDLLDSLESRFSRLYNPGQKFSLDETLICVFGKIKFKV